jgi:hypothetical protein
MYRPGNGGQYAYALAAPVPAPVLFAKPMAGPATLMTIRAINAMPRKNQLLRWLRYSLFLVNIELHSSDSFL